MQTETVSTAQKKPAPTMQELLEQASKETKDYRWNSRKSLVEMGSDANVSDVLISQLEKNELTNTSLKKLNQIAHSMGKKLVITFE